MKRLFPCAVILAALTSLPAARADAVLDWNAIATPIILAAGRPGPSLAIDFAVVHAAIHDSAQAYEKTYHPYATDIDGVGSPAAAIAKATPTFLSIASHPKLEPLIPPTIIISPQ